MTLTSMASRLAPSAWLHRPRPTARLRLTLFYSALFILSSVALLAIPYLLVRNESVGTITVDPKTGSYTYVGPDGHAGGFSVGTPSKHGIPATHFNHGQSKAVAEQLRALAASQHASELHQLLVYSAIALAVMAALSVLLGWLVAGRVLRPIRTINAAARTISASSLHERLHLEGPDDEFKELGSTLDDLLDRLDTSFESQRRFVANASHELRTPLTVERTLLQVALRDDDATAESLRATCEKLLISGREQEELIDALLTLASSERGLDHRERFDLAALVDDVLLALPADQISGPVRVDAAVANAEVFGDPVLTKRLVVNLVDNALQHNTPDGWVHVATGTTEDGRSFVRVENSGPAIPADEVERLLQPFQRLGPERVGRRGHGLGLAIVAAVAAAHHADLSMQPRPEGGLSVEVTFNRHGRAHDKDRLLPADSRNEHAVTGAANTPPTQTGRIHAFTRRVSALGLRH